MCLHSKRDSHSAKPALPEDSTSSNMMKTISVIATYYTRKKLALKISNFRVKCFD